MARMRTSLAIMGIASALLSPLGLGSTSATRAAEPAKALAGPPEMTAETEKGFHDLLLFIEKHEVLPGGAQCIRAAGVHRGRRVALEILLGPVWRAGSLGKDTPVITYQGEVRYRSMGTDSDAFLHSLDDLYGTQLKPSGMARETRFTGITLGGNPRKLGNGPVHVKLFYEAAGENGYAELYTNIDLASRRVEIREKDEEYRSPVVRALRADPVR